MHVPSVNYFDLASKCGAECQLVPRRKPSADLDDDSCVATLRPCLLTASTAVIHRPAKCGPSFAMSRTSPSPSDSNSRPDEKPNWRLDREPAAHELQKPSPWARWLCAAVATITWLCKTRVFTRDGGL